MPTHINKHGRRPGRGLRPWVLIPKILTVGALFGGFLAAAVILHSNNPQTLEQWRSQIQTIGFLFTRLIVPAVLLVILFGILLFLMHWRAFLSMRWFQVKCVLLLIALPPLHLSGRWLIGQARLALEAGDLTRVAELMANFTLAVDLTVLVLIVVIAIGRHKPRLDQRPKTVAQQRAASQSEG